MPRLTRLVEYLCRESWGQSWFDLRLRGASGSDYSVRVPSQSARERRERRFATGVVLLALVLSGCKKKPNDAAPPAPAASGSSVAGPAAAAGPRCRTTPVRSFSIGERAPPQSGGDAGEGEDDDQELALPFAVEIGSAVATPGGFAIAGLRSMAGGSGAFVAFFEVPSGSGRVVELGRTYGGADPPRLAAQGTRLVAVVPDHDASSGRLRLASIAAGASPPGVTWGGEISASRDQSAEFSVELGESRGVVVWDEFDKKHRRGTIRVSSFDAANVATVTEPRTISLETRDAEAPRLAPRPGGFWLAFSSRPSVAPDKRTPLAKAGPGASAKSPSDAGSDDSVVRVGQRGIDVVPLDANGSPTAEPRSVTLPRAHVMAFDIGAGVDGALLLAWRDDDTAPGVESGSVYMAKVMPDGSITRSVIEDDQGGAGVPSLVVDRQKPARAGAHPLWLALASVSDRTRLGALSHDGQLLDTLGSDPLLSNAEPLALRDGRLLLGRPRGMAVELSVIDCAPGPATVPAKGGG
jgi:hypothetical protein